jgi:hypothetical protein
METIDQQTTPTTTGGQSAGTTPQRKGGFVQGAPVAQGCCGEEGSSGGCCGAPTQTAAPTVAVQPASQGGGCCGASTSQGDSASTTSRCCG